MQGSEFITCGHSREIETIKTQGAGIDEGIIPTLGVRP